MYFSGVYETIAAIQALPVSAEPSMAYCLANGRIYAYHSAPATSFGVLPAANGADFLTTANGGDTRWICYEYDGTYSPTFTAALNVASNPTTLTSYFTRTGRFVSVFSNPTVDPAAGATGTEFTVSLPYTMSANFADATQASGAAWNRGWGSNTGAVWSPANVDSVAGAQTVTVRWTPDDATARPMNLNFSFWLL